MSSYSPTALSTCICSRILAEACLVLLGDGAVWIVPVKLLKVGVCLPRMDSNGFWPLTLKFL